MKSLLPFVGLAMLAACNQSAPVADKAEAAAPAGPHSNARPGTYVHTDAKGAMITTFLSDDGLDTNLIEIPSVFFPSLVTTVTSTSDFSPCGFTAVTAVISSSL